MFCMLIYLFITPPPLTLGQEIYNVLVNLSDWSIRWSREDFLNTSFLRILPQKYLRLGRGLWNLPFLAALPYWCCISNLVKKGSVVIEKKMLTDDARRTMHDDGSQPIAIGHLSDSGDLITYTFSEANRNKVGSKWKLNKITHKNYINQKTRSVEQ